jgi:hypothetical protein
LSACRSVVAGKTALASLESGDRISCGGHFVQLASTALTVTEKGSPSFVAEANRFSGIPEQRFHGTSIYQLAERTRREGWPRSYWRL